MATRNLKHLPGHGRGIIACAVAMTIAAHARADLYSSALVHYTFDGFTNTNQLADTGSAGVTLQTGGAVGSAGPATIVGGARPWTGNGLYIPDLDNVPNSDSGVILTPATAGSDTTLNTTRDTPFSLATWFKKSADGNGMFIASKQQSAGDFKGWLFQITRTGILQAIFRNQNVAAERLIVTSVNPVTSTDWVHLGMSFAYDATDATRGLKLYVDGQPVAVTATASNLGLAGADRDLSNSIPFTVSGRNSTQTDDGGYLDEFAIYKSALSAADFASFVTAPVTIKNFAAFGSATWSTPATWSPAGAPTATDHIKFGNITLTDAVVTIDSGGTVAATDVESTHKYTIALAGPTAFKAGALNIVAGTLAMQAGKTNTLRASSLTVATGAKLDLQDNTLVLDYTGATPLTAIQNAIKDGRITGAISGEKRIGFGESSAILLNGATTFGGQTITGSAILAKLVYGGDATLDGVVNFDDLVPLAQNYNGAGTWTSGDFTYDNVVNFDDLVLVAQNYNKDQNALLLGDAAFQADWALAQSLVPEPTSVAAVGMLAAGVLRRRR